MMSRCRTSESLKAFLPALVLAVLSGCSSAPNKDAPKGPAQAAAPQAAAPQAATPQVDQIPAPPKDERDPMEGWNRNVQAFNDRLDDYVMKPVAKGYKKVLPGFVDKGITNFYNNVDDVTVIGNDLLQFKLLQAGKDLGRFFINTTVGMAGFVDVADKMSLPKHNEDFDQTLAKWGVPSGPYVVLPMFGPSTPRGILGIAGDTFSNPINWVNPMAGYAWGTWNGISWGIIGSGGIRLVDQRADLLSASKIMDEASVDRYEFIRNAYFQQRNYVIHDGNPPPDEDLERQMDMDLEYLDKAEPKKPSASSAPTQAAAGSSL